MEAEIITKQLHIDSSLKAAIRVKNGEFSWDVPPQGDSNSSSSKTVAISLTKPHPDTPNENEGSGSLPFSLHDITLSIPRGQLCAIVGPVGSGKSSLLKGLLGEMPNKNSSPTSVKEGKESVKDGQVVFGDKVGYVPQIAWIQVRLFLNGDFRQ